MNCPNCGTKIQPGDKFCGECGADLTTLNQKEKFVPTSKIEENTHVQTSKDSQEREAVRPVDSNQQAPNENQPIHNNNSVHNEKVNGFLKETWNFTLDTFKSPTHTTLNANRYNVGAALTALALFILLNALVFTGMLSSLYSYGSMSYVHSFPFLSVMLRLFFVLALYFFVLYAVGLALSMIFNKSVDFKTLIKQYSSVFIISISLHVISLLFALLGSIQLYIFFMLLALIVLVFTPLYVFLINSENKNVGLDKLYISILHFLAIALGLLIVSLLSAEILAGPVFNFIDEILSDPFNSFYF